MVGGPVQVLADKWGSNLFTKSVSQGSPRPHAGGLPGGFFPW
jgi:hypothetical protein